MAKIYVIVEKIKDWNSYYPVEQLLTPLDYLVRWEELVKADDKSNERIKVINLCRSYKYLSNGYYCSLLAEARGHSVIPSVKSISDLSRQYFYNLDTEDLDQTIQKALKSHATDQTFSINIHFGKTDHEMLHDVARQIFDLFPAPILQVEFGYDKKWEVRAIRTGSINTLTPEQEDRFAAALDSYSAKIWRKPKARRKWRYDLAILHNPQEAMPPSDKKALQNFIKAGKERDVLVELIEKRDFARVAEYDALFIRETTALNHHTYRFAKKAAAEGLVVIDDPASILKCTNKIYLANLLKHNKLHAPRTFIVSRDNPEEFQQVIQEIGFPMIVKVPDGAFSRGVEKVSNPAELNATAEELFKKTALLLIQEFLPTDYDWRIGIMDNRAIFACKYYMSKGHWQIYNHKAAEARYKAGDDEAIPVSKVPKHVLSAALKSAHLIGDGLYGVDLKEKNGKAFVIEINDNPNIDADVEDAMLGADLYDIIINDFVRRIEAKR